MSNSNTIIELSDGRVFGGWNRLGEIVLKSEADRKLAYRMSGTLARRTIPKVEEFARVSCKAVPM